MPAAAVVCYRSQRDLARRQGSPPPRFRPRDLHPFLRHALKTDPKGFQVAVVDGKVASVAVTILRGRWQFLSLFWTLPGRQGRGIGRPALAAAFEAPRPPPGSVRCVLASTDLRAQSLYLKFGMVPRTTMYVVSGQPREALPPDLAVELHQVGPAGRMTTRALAVAARFDRPLRGARRDRDLRFLMGLAEGSRFYEARRDGIAVGYAMLRGKGMVGPAGVGDAALSEGLMAAVLAEARRLGMRRVAMWLPGLNVGALRACLAAGLRLDAVAAWMSARPLGDLAAYVPSGGTLF